MSPSTLAGNTQTRSLSFAHRYVMAPMVGASELAFRLLCRKYGTQLAYTPMMSAHQFAHDETYRQSEFQTCAADRPLVCHFWANQPQDFADAARVAAPFCDAVDLNLGCPQRTAYMGHYGSYLLEEKDRELLCAMVRAASEAVPHVPIFCKIRLLDTLEETTRLVKQLAQSGAALVAIHARYRASWERNGPGARDGPAHLDQILAIQQQCPGCKIIANGNTITWRDVENNLKLTTADGLMSAEGLLDNPALFLPGFGADPRGTPEEDKDIEIPIGGNLLCGEGPTKHENNDEKFERLQKKKRKIMKKLTRLEAQTSESLSDPGNPELTTAKASLLKKLTKVNARLSKTFKDGTIANQSETIKLSALYAAAEDKLRLAWEYIDLAERYPVKIRSVVFHVRRMLKDSLVKYQLLEDCIRCTSTAEIRQKILSKMEQYNASPSTFQYDQAKALAEKEALDRQRAQEGKRRAYEERMMRKAKREGKDLMHYLRIGADIPTLDDIKALKRILKNSRQEALEAWKTRNHSQHCFAFHLEECPRGRSCAFLHMECASSRNKFEEKDEVAG